jgi:hypothetical protein
MYVGTYVHRLLYNSEVKSLGLLLQGVMNLIHGVFNIEYGLSAGWPDEFVKKSTDILSNSF